MKNNEVRGVALILGVTAETTGEDEKKQLILSAKSRNTLKAKGERGGAD